MTCNCKSEVEQRLLENFKAAAPDATDHEVSLKGYGLMLVGNTFKLLPYMAVEGTSKNSKGRLKKSNQTMVLSFCPFCAEKISTTVEEK